MARMKAVAGVTEDFESCILQISKEDEPLAHIILDPSELDILIRGLADARSKMRDPVSPELDPSVRIHFENYPAWRVFAEHSGIPGIAMAFRHSGMGWLGFLLHEEQATAIGKSLSETPAKA